MAVARNTCCTVVRKGPIDVITDGKEVLLVSCPGSKKRCGGIGDILAGTIAAYTQFPLRCESLTENKSLMAIALACLTVRKASARAFDNKKHSLVASDVLECLSQVVAGCYPE